jgi:ABC-2 type transport system permease protein
VGPGLTLAVFSYAAFWPNIHANAGQFDRYLEKLPEAVRNMMGSVTFATPEGYIQAELFSLLGPILLLVFAIGAGARAIAGEEEAGNLDLLVSAPVSRRRIVLEKFGSLFIGTSVLTAVTLLSLVVIGPVYGLKVGLQGLGATILNLFLLGLAFGALALLVGSATGSKGVAIGVSSGVAVFTFIFDTLAPSVKTLRTLQFLSPFHYYSGHQPITNGFNGTDILVLVGISVVMLAMALESFERRDLTA